MSLFCICGGLAVDCLQQSKADALPRLIEAFGEIVEYELIIWINAHGGWVSYKIMCKSDANQCLSKIITELLRILIKKKNNWNFKSIYNLL